MVNDILMDIGSLRSLCNSFVMVMQWFPGDNEWV